MYVNTQERRKRVLIVEQQVDLLEFFMYTCNKSCIVSYIITHIYTTNSTSVCKEK